MMGQPKTMASLSSTLLARKGHARPAMRAQGFGGFGAAVDPIEDLGWNDMGHGGHDAARAEPLDLDGAIEVPEPAPAPLRAVVTEVPSPAPVIAPVRPRAAPGSKGKAAFTLRLDPVRHLRLRLASALGHRSAQQIVTQALDAYLQSLPDVEAAADRFGGHAGNQDPTGKIPMGGVNE